MPVDYVYTHTKSPPATLKGFCDLGEARTLDPLIKSQLLYRLSYQVILFFTGLQINGFFFKK